MKKIVIAVIALVLYSSVAVAGSSVGFHIDRNMAISGSNYQSEVIHFDDPMDRGVLSWNVFVVGKNSVKFQLRAKMSNGRFTPWYTMGVWGGKKGSTSVMGQKNAYGKVDVDTLILEQPSQDWQYRLISKGGGKDGWPLINNVALTVKNSKTFKKSDLGNNAKPFTVPAISQFQEAKTEMRPELARRICSPTSSAMALRYNGLKVPSLVDYAMSVFDKGSDMYGNWAFNTAGLYDGLVNKIAGNDVATYVRWYSSFDDLLTNVVAGQPVIVSIGFTEGDLDGAPIPTAGHLVVVRGADSKYVYVNDPAMPTDAKVATRYKRDQFVKAWKGIAYVIDKD